MDPWLERPTLWPDVHNRLIAELGNVLGPMLRPRYVVALEERVYLSARDGGEQIVRPDLSVHEPKQRYGSATGAGIAVVVPAFEQVRETWLEVRVVNGRVVTVVELLSPTNKVPGTGRTLYEEKRAGVLATRSHLVEVDLLRAGAPMAFSGTDRRSDYRILCSRGDRRPTAELLLFSVRDPIPVFALPLRADDDEPNVDLGAILQRLYDVASYDLRIDYTREPVPPLEPNDARWAARLSKGGATGPGKRRRGGPAR